MVNFILLPWWILNRDASLWNVLNSQFVSVFKIFQIQAFINLKIWTCIIAFTKYWEACIYQQKSIQ